MCGIDLLPSALVVGEGGEGGGGAGSLLLTPPGVGDVGGDRGGEGLCETRPLTQRAIEAPESVPEAGRADTCDPRSNVDAPAPTPAPAAPPPRPRPGLPPPALLALVSSGSAEGSSTTGTIGALLGEAEGGNAMSKMMGDLISDGAVARLPPKEAGRESGAVGRTGGVWRFCSQPSRDVLERLFISEADL